MAGLHPVVCVYATFLNRAFDQVLMDIALPRLPVTLVLDRAGVTGEDGASHHGMWDLAALSLIPEVRIAAPRDSTRLRQLLREALGIAGPTIVRFPKGSVGADIPAVRQVGSVDILRDGQPGGVLLVAVGATAEVCMDAATLCQRLGIEVTVADPRWVLPVCDDLLELASQQSFVVTVEDGCRNGGAGSALSDALREREIDLPVRCLGLPQRFLPHGTRAEILREGGLTADRIVDTVVHATACMAEPPLAAAGRRQEVAQP
jgi:1-deoxy-D-xylulose-5-phosphate synthase